MPTSVPTITTLSSREFNQNTGNAKKAAEHGPVIITDRGERTHVLITYLEYQKLREQLAMSNTTKPFVSAADALSHPASAHIDFEVPKLDYYARDIDLS